MLPLSPAHRPVGGEEGFSLTEVMISTLLLATVTSVVSTGMLGLGRVNDLVANRTEMHAAVRNATELLQQEVGQAGRVSLPAAAGPITATATAGTSTATVSSTAGMFANQYLVVGVGAPEETVKVIAVNSGTSITIDGSFTASHAAAPVSVSGGFAEGVVPTTRSDGSSATRLKLVGDINGDGNMVYVEYICDTTAGRLYRNSIPWNAGTKPSPTVEQVLLDNIRPNPDGTACFEYQEKTVEGTTYVLGVAITFTVRTHDKDPVTGDYLTETKALLNVSPRNVFNVWQMASLGYDDRIQPLPLSVILLLPDTSAEEN